MPAASNLQALSFVDPRAGADPVCYRVRSHHPGGRSGVSAEVRLRPAAGDDRAAVMALAARPNSFRGRPYAPGPLPVHDAAKLPRPIADERPAWVKLYDAAWRFAFKHVRVPARSTGFIATYADPVFNDHLFQWDTVFMLEYWRYGAHVFPAIKSLDNFYAKQHDDGFICREFALDGKEVHFLGLMDTANPPLYSWSEWEHHRLTGDRSRFAEVLVPIVKHYLWLQRNRTRPDGLYWNTGLGSGQDDLQRGGAHTWMDMNAQQAKNALYIAAIAQAAGEDGVVPFFVEQHLMLAAALAQKMWSKQDQFFYDLKSDGTVTGVRTSLAFWPLLARAASLEQVMGLERTLFDPERFWRPNVVPVLARGEKGYTPLGRYWNGSVWAPTNYVVVKGLDEYGRADSAARVADRYLDVLAEVLAKTGTIWEYYAGESATGQGKQEYGWSNLGPIALLIEDGLGIRASGATGTIVWRPRLAGRNGIEDLMVGPARVSLVASAVAGGQRTVTMSADRPVRVYLEAGGATATFDLGGQPIEARVPAPH